MWDTKLISFLKGSFFPPDSLIPGKSEEQASGTEIHRKRCTYAEAELLFHKSSIWST